MFTFSVFHMTFGQFLTSPNVIKPDRCLKTLLLIIQSHLTRQACASTDSSKLIFSHRCDFCNFLSPLDSKLQPKSPLVLC